MNKDISIDSKKKFIYNNIISVNDTKNIINFVINNNIPYSQNTNGMHINISILEDKFINEIYNIIFYDINDKDNEEEYLNEYNKAVKNIKSISKKNNYKETPVYQKLKLTDIQKEMINLIQ